LVHGEFHLGKFKTSKNLNGSSVSIASLNDSAGILAVLKSNLIEIEDAEELTSDKRQYFEEHGFLRKEVNEKFYRDLIRDHNWHIYIVKSANNKILGFASVNNNKSNVYEFRSTLEKIYTKNERTRTLLTNVNMKFAYLDQISINPDYQRKGLATILLNSILSDVNLPLVAFIVELPLANKASAKWHEYNRFEIAATAYGNYKGKQFKWRIYIHWNRK